MIKINEEYADDVDGVIDFVKNETVFNDSDEYWAYPDPQVPNVWLVFIKDREYIESPESNHPPYGALIVYLKENDFEMIYDVEEAIKKYAPIEVRSRWKL